MIENFSPTEKRHVDVSSRELIDDPRTVFSSDELLINRESRRQGSPVRHEVALRITAGPDIPIADLERHYWYACLGHSTREQEILAVAGDRQHSFAIPRTISGSASLSHNLPQTQFRRRRQGTEDR